MSKLAPDWTWSRWGGRGRLLSQGVRPLGTQDLKIKKEIPQYSINVFVSRIIDTRQSSALSLELFLAKWSKIDGNAGNKKKKTSRLDKGPCETKKRTGGI